jgi:hypothetical protein
VTPLDAGSTLTTVTFARRLEALVLSDEHGRVGLQRRVLVGVSTLVQDLALR